MTNNWNMNRSIRKRYIARLLLLLNGLCVFMYILIVSCVQMKSQKFLKLLAFNV